MERSYDFEDTQMTWIEWFCQLQGNEFFVPVDRKVTKPRNILRQKVPSRLRIFIAMDLYGLIHKRFIATKKGLALIRDKYITGVFGKCPRFYCNSFNCLPVGTSSELNVSRAKIYCPNCRDVYKIKTRHDSEIPISIDGAYFGKEFPHFFLMEYPEFNSDHGPVKLTM